MDLPGLVGRFVSITRTLSCAAALAVAAVCVAQTSTPSAADILEPPPPVMLEQSRPSTARRPDAAGRVVRVFDFEESTTNPTDLPRFWRRGQDNPAASIRREGFPTWNQARLTYVPEGGAAAAGEGSVELPTRGGSTSLILEQGVLPIFEGADYLVSASVRSAGLRHAQPALAARFLTASGEIIPGSEVTVRTADTQGAWKVISAELWGRFPTAAFLQIELLLLQPDRFQQRTLGQFHLFPADVAGSAWFDDVTVVQLPRVDLSTQSPLNVILAPERPRIEARVRDLTGEALSLRFRAIDAFGRVVDSTTDRVGGGRSAIDWTPRLTDFGWYRIVMEVENDAGPVGGRTLDIAFVPPPSGALTAGPASLAARDRLRLGLIISSIPPELQQHIPALVTLTGGGAVTLPVWSSEGQARPADESWLRATVDQLLARGSDVTFSLERAPPELVRGTGISHDDPWSLLVDHPDRWKPSLDALLDRYGQRVRRWQVGAAGDDEAFARPDVASEVASLRTSLETLVTGPVVTIPTRLDRAWQRPQLAALGDGAALAALAPADMPAESVGLAADALAEAARDLERAPDLTIIMERAPDDRFGVGPRLEALVKRAVNMWAATRDAAGHHPDIAIPAPWEVRGWPRASIMPAPELPVFRQLAQRLAGRRVVGQFDTADGVVCLILAPEPVPGRASYGALVAWNERAAPADAVIEGYLGDGPVRIVDIFGNESLPQPAPASASDDPADRRRGYRIPLSSSPIFIENVDVALAQFLAGVALDDPFIESGTTAHDKQLILANPWLVTLTGRVSILQPGGVDPSTGMRDRTWRVSPRVVPFSIAPGESARLPFSIAFTPSTDVGTRELVLGLELAADRPYGNVIVRRPLEIGLSGIRMDLSSITGGPDGTDLIVEAAVSSTREREISVALTAFAPDQPRAKASINQLRPGDQVIHRFIFPGAAAAARGKRVVVSLVETESSATLNRSTLVP